MNRKTDPVDFDTTQIRHDSCLKESEWREVHDFIAGTKEYRKGLCDKLDLIRKDIHGWNVLIWSLALAILIPLVSGFVWIGHMDKQVEVNTKRWDKVIDKGGIK